jgi:uncharacterized protein YggT (Ycf19 family)
MQASGSASPPPHRVVLWVTRVLLWVIYVYVILVEGILLYGFLSHTFGLDPNNAFQEWQYRNLAEVMEPFRGLFPTITFTVGRQDVPASMDTSILFAGIVYAFLGLGLLALLRWISARLNDPEPGFVARVVREDHPSRTR